MQGRLTATGRLPRPQVQAEPITPIVAVCSAAVVLLTRTVRVRAVRSADCVQATAVAVHSADGIRVEAVFVLPADRGEGKTG